ncbi:hypothetical protein GMW39_00010 [Pectobacterium parmentieri]|uniref:UxaA family hydrolase n=1 Tax=Pectobacterium parmentieri TaxID=1905730 RepID=UPI0013745C32|nr:hypothetical protein GMW39_00010 [Pectobacterium parmentieri]
MFGFRSMVDDILTMARQNTCNGGLNKRQRRLAQHPELVVGMQCGGSDAFSASTAIPAPFGLPADLLVRCGATVHVF